MNLAVLRVAADGAVVQALLARHQIIEAAAWYEGETDSLGRTRADSGFNVTVADARSAGELVDLMEEWLAESEPFLRDLATSSAVATLDVGFTVHSGRPNRTVCFTPALLQRYADVGLSLEVSAYLSSPPDVSAESSER
jgi:hypothetical protein